MLKDIQVDTYEGVAVAAIFELNDEQEMVWNVYVINYTNGLMEGVLVSSKGYGTVNGEEKKTSSLRHFLDTLEPLSYQKIEPIQPDLFALSNEYWMSYYVAGKIFEKKYIFEANTIAESGLETVSLINKPGILLI